MFKKKTRVEDPARIKNFTGALGNLSWTAADYRGSLNKVFEEITDLIQAEIDYYYERRQESRRFSELCRASAWLLATFGLLVPLIYPILGTEVPESFLWWGYAAFGLAGSVLVADSLFAGTQAHHRNTKTQLEIEQIVAAFTMKWEAGLVKLEVTPTEATVVALLNLAEAAINSVHKAMGTETSQWKKDVTEGIGQLKGRINSGGKGH